jgi:putative iron-dependent peroxidase
VPTPQHGIFALGTRSHHHLQLDVVDDAAPDEVLAAIRSLRERATTTAGVNLVAGFGSRFAAEVVPDWVPARLEPFQPIVGPDGTTFPADQHDLWIWLHASGPDAVFDLASRAARCLDGLAVVASEQPAFTYQASRDLTGFEDGTENPPLDAAPGVATIPDGQRGAGGSVVLLQRWVHDLVSFEALPPGEQEQVIGRSKVTSEELPDDVRSPRAHISRVVIEDDGGDELEVFRRSTAYGGVLEHGLMFLAFSADVDRLARMLRRMAGEGDGVRDRLTDFTRSTGGAWYVAPPLEAFAEPG